MSPLSAQHQLISACNQPIISQPSAHHQPAISPPSVRQQPTTSTRSPPNPTDSQQIQDGTELPHTAVFGKNELKENSFTFILITI
jgi:hypothetical protein